MARIRTVKPELFLHEELYGLEAETNLPVRLAWIGLFTVADREGRFKWQPNILKLHILPWDNVDFSKVLEALESHQFIKRYKVNGKFYGYIPSFNIHQRVKSDEGKSQLPPPPNLHNQTETGVELDPDPTPTGVQPESDQTQISVVELEMEKEKEGNGSTAKGNFNFDRIYLEYPRKEGKQQGLQICASRIKTPEQYKALLGAVQRYRAYCEREGTEKKYIKHFSTFMSGEKWRDWLEPETGTAVECRADSHIDWSKFS